MQRESEMELSKHIPPKFEVGDLVLLTNKNLNHIIDGQWVEKYNNTFGIIKNIDWKWERLEVVCFDGTRADSLFKAFELMKKNSKLVKLLFQ
jgi:hypothetical protein